MYQTRCVRVGQREDLRVGLEVVGGQHAPRVAARDVEAHRPGDRALVERDGPRTEPLVAPGERLVAVDDHDVAGSQQRLEPLERRSAAPSVGTRRRGSPRTRRVATPTAPTSATRTAVRGGAVAEQLAARAAVAAPTASRRSAGYSASSVRPSPSGEAWVSVPTHGERHGGGRRRASVRWPRPWIAARRRAGGTRRPRSTSTAAIDERHRRRAERVRPGRCRGSGPRAGRGRGPRRSAGTRRRRGARSSTRTGSRASASSPAAGAGGGAGRRPTAPRRSRAGSRRSPAAWRRRSRRDHATQHDDGCRPPDDRGGRGRDPHRGDRRARRAA